VTSKFSPYITFLRHIINISSLTFLSPTTVTLYYPPIPHYNYKILLSNPIHLYYYFQLLNRKALCKGRYSVPLDLGERRGLPCAATRRGAFVGRRCARRDHYTYKVQGEGARRDMRCGQP
jgi:hypothetical protein